MPRIPDVSRTIDTPVGPLRDKYKYVQSVGANDVEIPGGFICQVATVGNITYRTLGGIADQTESGLSVGDTINVGGHAVLLQVVRGSSTVTSIIVGRL